MTPLVLVAAGVVALLAAAAVLRSFGPRYRVGRLLATTPRVSVAEANRLAAEGRPRYVRVDGRIDADDEFEDADHRPLVFRRTRLEVREGRSWRAFEDDRRAVPFRIDEGLDSIAVDDAALDAGLVVVPRESAGVAADLADRAPASVAPDRPVRAIVEQISSVEHAIVLGLPEAGAGPGQPARMTAGLGRPLVLTTLEPAEAMRVLAGGTARPRLAAALLAGGLALLAVGLAWAGLGALAAVVVPAARAASPLPSPAPGAGGGGDPRSEGEGPGLVGEPVLALLGVLAIALAAVLVTSAWVRLTAGREAGRPRRR